MPIRQELRRLYPSHWSELSRRVRFERAGGVCQTERKTWRNGRGRSGRWPDLEQAIHIRSTRVVLAAAHLDHDPSNNRLSNLRSLCQRCHLIHDRPYHLAQRRITYLLRRAMGDLFLGPYCRGLADE